MSDVKLLAVDVEFRAIDETGQCVVAQHDQHDEKKRPWPVTALENRRRR